MKLYDVKVYGGYGTGYKGYPHYPWLDMILSAHTAEQAEDHAYSILAGKTYREAFGCNAGHFAATYTDERIGFNNIYHLFHIKVKVFDEYKLSRKTEFPPQEPEWMKELHEKIGA